ncbi:MAG: TOTE conflict system archaeo-eukaryotic primase domain-containing protein [Limisphaerales bacterium]
MIDDVDSMFVEQKLADALSECERLRAENRDLRNRLRLPRTEASVSTDALVAPPAGAAINSKSSPEEKVKLFRSLFRGREDVYAVRWEGRRKRNTVSGMSTEPRKSGQTFLKIVALVCRRSRASRRLAYS